MKWKSVSSKSEKIARACQQELDQAGIRTDFFTVGDYFYVGYAVAGKEQSAESLRIVTYWIYKEMEEGL